MSLKTSEVFKCLDKKTLIFGFEVFDLFVVFAALGILNMIFGSMPYKFLWTWVPTLALAAVLKVSKAGKPDNYLLHLVRYQFSAGTLSAFTSAGPRTKFRRRVSK